MTGDELRQTARALAGLRGRMRKSADEETLEQAYHEVDAAGGALDAAQDFVRAARQALKLPGWDFAVESIEAALKQYDSETRRGEIE